MTLAEEEILNDAIYSHSTEPVVEVLCKMVLELTEKLEHLETKFQRSKND